MNKHVLNQPPPNSVKKQDLKIILKYNNHQSEQNLIQHLNYPQQTKIMIPPVTKKHPNTIKQKQNNKQYTNKLSHI